MKVFIKAKSEQLLVQVLKLNTRSTAVRTRPDDGVVIANLPEEQVARLRADGDYEVFDDIQFQPAFEPWWERSQPMLGPAAPWASKTQADVMDHIRASVAWQTVRGGGTTIAVVDTGTDASLPQFPRRSAHSTAPAFSTPDDDTVGHGTMCAAIACGSTEVGGRYKGVAPDAELLTARSTLLASDLYQIYEHLLSCKQNGLFPRGLVVSNSYGLYACQAPQFPAGHPYVDLVRLCVTNGIVFVFAAGNNHAGGLCRYPPPADQPNTIWTVNSIDDVITVGTVDWNETNQAAGEHANSSRGPGQWSTRQDKPDVVAPTYGEVAWGGGYRAMEWWGTSGACPQVAGLAALLLAKNTALTPRDVMQIIKASARRLNAPAACVGQGVIDCGEALKLA